jgi:DNA (cytosine-5)-methyltransferase 1
LKRAGFSVRAAVELDEDAAKTYRINHRGTPILVSDIREVTSSEIRAAVGERQIDLLVGCAPCQGFCSLTRKNRTRDPRNALLLEMARLVRSLRPTAVLMENVPGLADVGKRVFGLFLRALRQSGYTYDWRVLQMADYGLPQSRRRLVLLAGRGFAIPFPEPTHAKVQKKSSGLKPWVTVRDAIGGRHAPVTLDRSWTMGGPQAFKWHVVRDLKAQTKARLRAAYPGGSRMALGEELLPECHQDGYEGFRNVYGRMSWESPSPTITGGCVTPAKGRFGHPDRRRTTISVREAALLQTFPSTYHFQTESIDAACEMIGNAVPPRFAQVLGTQLRTHLAKRLIDEAATHVR